jgi:D-serine deaminase-like pyridoxal phosphate-dependent protein
VRGPQPGDLAALRSAHERGCRVRLAVDGAAGVHALAAAMSGLERPFPVVIDCDLSLRPLGGRVHIGVRRSPVRTDRDLEALLDEIARSPSLAAVGVLAYEAQVAGLGDRNAFTPLENPVKGLIRRRSRRAVARRRAAIAALFARRGLALEVFNGGGSGSLDWASAEPHLTEVTAGSGLLGPHLFDYYSNIHFEPALFFALQAVRSSDPDYVTCLGGGYIASGEPGRDRLPLPWLPEGLRLVDMEGCGEVQTPLRQGATRVAPGQPILFRPAKSGELAERFNEYLLCSGGRVVARVPTYRGLGRCFY